MVEYGFFLNLIFLYKNRIFDSALIPENTDERKPLHWHILRSKCFVDFLQSKSLSTFLNTTQSEVQTE